MDHSGDQNQYTQHNSPVAGGQVFAHQGTGNQIINMQARRRRADSIALLVTLVVNVLYFFYGMSSYTGRNTTADEWRAGIFLLLLVVTIGMVRRWFRRRL